VWQGDLLALVIEDHGERVFLGLLRPGQAVEAGRTDAPKM